MSRTPITKKHGTTTGYARGCRCDKCRAASSAYQRQRMQAKRAGTWNPQSPKKKEPRVCSFPGCGRPARYVTPRVLCIGHRQQLDRGKPLAPLKRKRFVQDGMKECRVCGRVLPVDQFYAKAPRKGDHAPHSECMECSAVYHRAYQHGLSIQETKRLMGTPCAGCGIFPKGRTLHIDHCHDTGKVRGVLCHNCNTVLTKHMTPETMRRLADYLEAARSA